MAFIVDGKGLALSRENKLLEKIKLLKVRPKVVSILVGKDPSSVLYTSIKQKKAEEIGIEFQPVEFPETTNIDQVKSAIEKLGEDATVNGIMVQLPLPVAFLRGEDPKLLLALIDPAKDVDGLTGMGPFLPAAVQAVLNILKDLKVNIAGKKTTVLGASDLVGKPVASELAKLGSEVRVCDSKTEDLGAYTKTADFVVSATGVPGILKGDMVREGVVVIDVGAEKVGDRVVGDVDFVTVEPKASIITPVPGGVGPMTVISLMENVVKSVGKGRN